MKTVYILKLSNGKFYTGCTGNLSKRLNAHQKGESNYTRDHLPFELITSINFSDKRKAYDFERYLKSGSGIAFRNKRLV